MTQSRRLQVRSALELKHQAERSEDWMVVGWAGDDRIKLRFG
jgi:hypothetical protein